MKLVIGGCFQGKLDYVLKNYELEDCFILEQELPDITLLPKEGNQKKTIIMNHFHVWVKRNLEQGKNPEQEILEFVNKNPDCIIISDEIGNGIVPIDSFEREYRERTGRVLIKLAEQADEVIRVICGIGQKIK